MPRQLSPQEKRLIEAEFVARDEASTRQRAKYQRVFIVGISAGLIKSLLHGFGLRGWLSGFTAITWLICVLIYLGSSILPISFQKDTSPSWHLNPWRDALQNLAQEKSIAKAITLLAGPYVIKMLASFIYWSFK